MIDEDYNPWLIEINSSPCFEYSTEVTKRLVKMVSEDTVKVIVDHNMAPKKKKKSIDTGKFECIYRGKEFVDKPLNSVGLNLFIEG